jgi:hypothetical protein
MATPNISKKYKKSRLGPDEDALERNKALSRVLKYNKTRKRLCVYDRYEIFRPFFGKYKGIEKSCLLQKDDKVILLMGEIHDTTDLAEFLNLSNFFDDLIHSLDEEILEKTNSTLDFFLEVTQDEACFYRSRDDKKYTDELSALRDCVTPYIPYSNKNPKRKKNVRFHFSDYEHKGGILEDLFNIFDENSVFLSINISVKKYEDVWVYLEQRVF